MVSARETKVSAYEIKVSGFGSVVSAALELWFLRLGTVVSAVRN